MGLLAGLLVDLLVDLLADLLADLLVDLLVDLLAGLLAAWWGQEARPRWGNHGPPAGRRMGLPLKEARSRAPRAPSRPARSFRKMCPSRTNISERAPPTSMVSASSLTQTRIASCGPTSRSNPGPTLLHGHRRAGFAAPANAGVGYVINQTSKTTTSKTRTTNAARSTA
jgi:hypothetical protein